MFTTAFGPHMAKAPASLQAFVWIEGAVNIVLLAAWVYAIVLMVTKRMSFPRVFRGLALASIAFVLTDIVVNSAVFGGTFTADDGLTLVRQAIVCLIWIPYMAQSVRVRNTFVR